MKLDMILSAENKIDIKYVILYNSNMIGLSKNELKVFKKLTLNPQTVAELVRVLHMPRMTVYTTLLRLKKMKLVKEIESESGKRMLWVKNQDSVIKKSVEEVKETILGVSGKNTGNLLYYKGKKEIGDKLMELTLRRHGATMYAIQHTYNFGRWVSVMGKDWVNRHNKAVVDAELVAFTIHSPTVSDVIKKDVEIIDAYKGRRGNSHVIPEQFLKKDLAFYIFDDTIFLVNLAKIEATLLVDEDIASFLVKMVSFMFEKSNEEEFFLKFGRL